MNVKKIGNMCLFLWLAVFSMNGLFGAQEEQEQQEKNLLLLLTCKHNWPIPKTEKFPSVNFCNRKDGVTPLHWACSHRNDDNIRTLLDAHADPNVKDPNGYTPIIYYCFGATKANDRFASEINKEPLRENIRKIAYDFFIKGMDLSPIEITNNESKIINGLYCSKILPPLIIDCLMKNQLDIQTIQLKLSECLNQYIKQETMEKLSTDIDQIASLKK